MAISYTLTSNLQYSNSSHGWALNATIYVGSSSTTAKIKGTESWSGTAKHTVEGSFTVSGLSASTTSLSTALKVESPSSGAGSTLAKTSGSSLSISSYVVPEGVIIPAPALIDNSHIAIIYIE